MTYELRDSEVPGAGSPLSRAVLAGPPREAQVLASFPTVLYLSAGEHHDVLPVLASDALILPTGTRLSAPGRDIVWGVVAGDSVAVGEAAITLPGWRIRLVREWRPARVRAVSGLDRPRFMSEMAASMTGKPHAAALDRLARGAFRATHPGGAAGRSGRSRRESGGGDSTCTQSTSSASAAPLDGGATTRCGSWKRTTDSTRRSPSLRVHSLPTTRPKMPAPASWRSPES